MTLGRAVGSGDYRNSAAASDRGRLRHRGRAAGSGNPAIALLANSIATGAGLYTLIIVFGPISGAHFNPVVSAASVWEGRSRVIPRRRLRAGQISGAFAWRRRTRCLIADLSSLKPYPTDAGRGTWRSSSPHSASCWLSCWHFDIGSRRIRWPLRLSSRAPIGLRLLRRSPIPP